MWWKEKLLDVKVAWGKNDEMSCIRGLAHSPTSQLHIYGIGLDQRSLALCSLRFHLNHQFTCARQSSAFTLY